MDKISNETIFPKGDKLPKVFSKNFVGQAYLQVLATVDEEWNCPIGNVTFEPGCRNNWHKHPGGQILLVTGGIGWYQEHGKAAQKLRAGDVVKIPANTRHWHGATKDSELTHIYIETNPQKGGAEWMEAVSDKDYNKLE